MEAISRNLSTDSYRKEFEDERDLKLLKNIEIVRLCSESLSQQYWVEFQRRFDKHIRSFLQKAWCKCLLIYTDNYMFQDLLQDFLQSVYLRLIESNMQALKIFKGDEDSAFLAYLAKICTNIVRSHFRQRNASKRKALEVSLESIFETTGVKETRKELYYRVENGITAQIVLKELSDVFTQLFDEPEKSRNRKIFRLYIYEGFTVRQITKIKGVNLTVNCIDKIIKTIKERLKIQLYRRLEDATNLSNDPCVSQQV